jgi:hypothetical protein
MILKSSGRWLTRGDSIHYIVNHVNEGDRRMSALPQVRVHRQRRAAEWLERVARALDLTDAQLEQARDRYGSVGRWLASSI